VADRALVRLLRSSLVVAAVLACASTGLLAPSAAVTHPVSGAARTAPAPTVSVRPASVASSRSTALSRMRTEVPGASVVVDADFEGRPSGRVRPSAFVAEVGDTNRSPAEYDDMTFRKATGHGTVVRTTLEKGTIRGVPSGNHGAVLVTKLPRTYHRACISYDVRFADGFDFSLGGKLPGLLGVAPGTSPSTPTGGGSTARGWSGRVMWLGPQAYSWAGPGNMGVTYLYHPGQPDVWGENVRWNKPFVAGRWHSVTQCYSVNTVGRADGRLVVWRDGVQVRHDTRVVYRTRSDVGITHLDWSVFRGGGDLRWAGSRTGAVDLDNLVVLAR
jgi:hypothetical protein